MGDVVGDVRRPRALPPSLRTRASRRWTLPHCLRRRRSQRTAHRGACLGLVVIGALVGGPVNDVAALGRASGRTRRAHVPSGGGRCLVGGGARVHASRCSPRRCCRRSPRPRFRRRCSRPRPCLGPHSPRARA